MSDGEYKLRAHGRLPGGGRWNTVIFTVGAVTIIGITGGAAGGIIGTLYATGQGFALVSGTFTGAAAIGGAAGVGVGFELGIINARHSTGSQTSTSNPTTYYNENEHEANTTQYEPPRDIPCSNNPFRKNKPSAP